MLCALFKSCLVIATARKSLTLFDVVASIPLLNTSIEDADNGKGTMLCSSPANSSDLSQAYNVILHHSHGSSYSKATTVFMS